MDRQNAAFMNDGLDDAERGGPVKALSGFGQIDPD
jgi:hypothetical protein